MIYTVKDICGDYAKLKSEDGEEISISTFLLPTDLMIEDKLKTIGIMQYEKMQKGEF